MANLRTTPDIKKAVLQVCGELTDSTSPYDSIALAYINKAYKDLFAGGNIFGVDVSEPWTWARSREPVLLSLLPEYDVGSVTMTNGTFDGIFSNPPSTSVEGYFLKPEDENIYYQIKQHTAGSPNFQIDQLWTYATGAGNYRVFPLEYDLFDDKIIIPASNRYLDFQENGSVLSGVLSPGVYTTAQAVAAVQLALSTVGSNIYSVTFNIFTRKFNVTASSGTVLSIRTVTGANAQSSAWQILGFPTTDLTGSLSYTSDRPLNAIQRLVAPILTSGPGGLNLQTGKIYGVGLLALQERFGGNYISPYYPSVFAELHKYDNGTVRIRFDAYPSEILRAEVNYIPIAEELFDNEFSIPKMPESYRDYLVYAASSYLLTDKNDDKTAKYEGMSVAKLRAMVSDARSNVKLTNNQYGKIIPRAGGRNNLYWSTTRGKED